jgi:hypothetical protein
MSTQFDMKLNTNYFSGCNNRELFTYFIPFQTEFIDSLFGRTIPVQGVGTVVIPILQPPNSNRYGRGELILENVLFCPALPFNVIGNIIGGDMWISEEEGWNVLHIGKQSTGLTAKFTLQVWEPDRPKGGIILEHKPLMHIQWPEAERSRFVRVKLGLRDGQTPNGSTLDGQTNGGASNETSNDDYRCPSI